MTLHQDLPPADPEHPEVGPVGRLTGSTRRSFIRGIAAAGASTMAASALDSAGVVDLFADAAQAQPRRTPFSEFRALPPSGIDQFEVPAGFRADVLIEWGDRFTNNRGERMRYGFNNDFLAYFPIRGSNEGLIFVNHEYPDPFFLHGYGRSRPEKTPRLIAIEQEAVGNSIVHIKKDSEGLWRVVRRSRYNRRITGSTPEIDFTGPLRGMPQIGASANGSIANCSGGITPWGTALSCEENFQSYGSLSSGGYGWGGEYDEKSFAKYGWVVEHDPYDPNDRGVKHTALGRFRHENTAFRQAPGKKFVLYMGDDSQNEGVYKFVSDLSFRRGSKRNNRNILRGGTLYIARWEPEGRRRFARRGDPQPVTPTSGTGTWVKVEESELIDTSGNLRKRFSSLVAPGVTEYDARFATNRPEDVEVHRDGRVFIALTNNSTVNDAHGSIRVLAEEGNDPESITFSWLDYAAGGPSGRPEAGEGGFSSPDNIVFDRANNMWVVTDISSSSLNRAGDYRFHGNNAVFMVPTSGPNAGVAFRFANMPVQAEGTGPYFTPDEQTLFINVQHPGEETSAEDSANPGTPGTFSSYWPRGNRSLFFNPEAPRPSTVVITRDRAGRGSREVPDRSRKASQRTPATDERSGEPQPDKG